MRKNSSDHCARWRLLLVWLILWCGVGVQSAAADELKVWEYRGIVPGRTTSAELLRAESWKAPAARRQVSPDVELFEYQIPGSRVSVTVSSGVVSSVDLILKAPVDQVVGAFQFTDPLNRETLPETARIGTDIDPGWKPRQFGCGRVIVFTDPDNNARLVRFYGPAVLAQELSTSIGITMKLVPAGLFLMGTSEDPATLETEFGLPRGRFSDEVPQHQVRISRPFYMSAHEITVAQFRRFVTDAKYRVQAAQGSTRGPRAETLRTTGKSWDKPDFPQEESHPVVYVSWDDSVAFCKWLSMKEGHTFRLPTEAEWEYACRAGSQDRFFSGNDEQALVQIANVLDASAKAARPEWKTTIRGNDGFAYTSPVGSFRSNAFGLFDMHGNVWEWCSDWYAADYYANSPTVDPPGPDRGQRRLVRGGCWY